MADSKQNSNDNYVPLITSTNYRCFECNRSFPDKSSFKTLGTDGKIWVGICWDCAERKTPKKKKKDIRTHERAYLDWGVIFLHISDWVTGRGVIRDISRGGVRFFTDVKLAPTSLLDLEIRSNDNTLILKEKAKVMRSTPIEEGFEIGAMFVIEAKQKGASDRRRYIRYDVGFMIEFRTGILDPPSMGKVLDISQGGTRFISTRKLKKGTQLYLVIDNRKLMPTDSETVSDSQGTPSQVRHLAKVVGIKQNKGHYEVRVVFLKPAKIQNT